MSVHSDQQWLLERRVFHAALQGDTKEELAMVSLQLIPDVLFQKTVHENRCHTPLTVAAHNGNTEAVLVLLDYQRRHCGGDLKLRSNTNTFEAIYEAAEMNHLALVKTILVTNEIVNGVGCSGESVLHVLCRSETNVRATVDVIIHRGAKLDITDAKGETCLFNACREGREDMVELLLANGADPNHRSLTQATPLHVAAIRQDCGVARLLLQHRARVSQDGNGYTALMWAAIRPSIKCVELLLTFCEFSRKEEMDALELLGAVLSRYENMAYTYLKRAMDERYRDYTDIICKPQRPPVTDLGGVLESQTPQELASIQYDWHKLGLEGLLVMERILGEYNTNVVVNCDFLCRHLIGEHRYGEAFAVWKYSRKHSVFDTNLSRLDYHISDIFHGMHCRGSTPTFPHYRQVLDLTVQEMEVQSRASEQDREYLRCAAINMSECVNYIMRALPLASSDSDLSQLQDLTKRLTSMAPRLHTLPIIHIAWRVAAIRLLHLQEDPGFTALFVFLAKCGAEVSEKDNENNTPLHQICGKEWIDQDFLKFSCSIARLLLELGADVDARNGENRSPLDMATSEDMRAVLLEYYPVSLKCLAASAIVQGGIPYQGRVPSAVENFIRIHDSC